MFNLLEELEKYIPYNKEEKLCVDKLKDFLKYSTNCYDRTNLNGHITAGGLVCDKKGNVLLNYHKKALMWFQFGGHCDNDTNLINVSKREILEESGKSDIYSLNDNKIFDVDNQQISENKKKNEPAHIHYDVNFLYFSDSYEFKISEESKQIKWFTIEEAFKVVDKADHGTIRILNKYREFINKLNK